MRPDGTFQKLPALEIKVGNQGWDSRLESTLKSVVKLDETPNTNSRRDPLLEL